MKIYLTDQTRKFERHLPVLRQKPLAEYQTDRLTEKRSCINLGPGEPDLQLLSDYAIFPPAIMRHLSEWRYHRRAMRVGDTIVQQVRIPPGGIFSLKLVFGVRIRAIIDEPGRKGFRYATLRGHPERGLSTFTFERSGNNLIFCIHTYSTPGNFLAWILGPVFTRPFQAYCTRQALRWVKRQYQNK